MKLSALDKKYGKNKTLAKEGFPFKVPDSDVVFLIRQFDSIENAELVKKAMTEDFKPLQRQIQNDALPLDKVYALNVKVWCKIALAGWQNLVDDDGKEILFSLDTAVEMMLKYEDLYKILTEQSRDSSNFSLELGND